MLSPINKINPKFKFYVSVLDSRILYYVYLIKRKIVATFLLLFLFLINSSGQGQSKRVLFIGNSYTFVNNMPQITATIASSVGDQLIFNSSAISSYSLQLHSTNTTTLGLIRQGGWNYVVLQEHSQYPSEPLSWVQTNVYPYAQYLDGEINRYNTGVETIFYMTWGRKNGDADRCPRLPSVCTYIGMDDLTRERYMYMAQANQAVVSPVGAVWRYIRDNYPTIELYDTDGSHPSPAGSYAAACCFYTAIFRKDPTLITYNFTLSADNASKIRAAAKQVVFNNLNSWYLSSYQSYSVSASAGTGGTINPSGTQYVASGSNITFTISPNNGYKISDVKADNVSVGAVSSYTFRNVTGNHSISATFTSITFEINASAGTGGKINPAGSVNVNFGANRTFTVSADNGYRIEDLIVDNSSVGSPSSYTFLNITSNHTISAKFVPLTYSLTGYSGPNGTINPSGTLKVNYGTGQTFNMIPNNGFQVNDVLVDNQSVGSVSKYIFTNITSDHTISVSFKNIILKIKGTAGLGGVINPSGTITLNYGDSQNYTIIPDKGFQIKDVLVDNSSAGSVSNYTFQNVTADHSISALFSPVPYSITSTAGPGGSVEPRGQVRANYGNDLVFNFIPDKGYKISSIMLDYLPVQEVTENFQLTNITQDHIISVSFSKIMTYTLTTGTGKNGTIIPSGSINVQEGSEQSFKILPSSGYRVSNVFIDSIPVGQVSEYTFANISGDHSISATFTKEIRIEIYPNPFQDEFNFIIRSPYNDSYKVTLVTLGNRIVYSNPDVSSNIIIRVKPDIRPGLYILNVYLKGTKVIYRRVIKD